MGRRGLRGSIVKVVVAISEGERQVVRLRRTSCYSLRVEVKIKVPETLAAEARVRGLRVETYMGELLAQRLVEKIAASRPRSPEEIRAWLDSLAQFSDEIPPLPEAISREWIYGEHDQWRFLRVWSTRAYPCASQDAPIPWERCRSNQRPRLPARLQQTRKRVTRCGDWVQCSDER